MKNNITQISIYFDRHFFPSNKCSNCDHDRFMCNENTSVYHYDPHDPLMLQISQHHSSQRN